MREAPGPRLHSPSWIAGRDSPFPPRLTRPRFQAMRLTTTTSSSSTLTTPARTATRTGRGLPARWKRLPRVCRATWTSTPGCATDRLSGGSRRLRGSRSLRGPSSTTATAAWRRDFALGLTRLGVKVDVVPLALDRAGYSPQFLALVDNAQPVADAPTLACAWPREDLSRLPPTRDSFFYTMWESSRLPQGWSEAFAACRAVFVPTTLYGRCSSTPAQPRRSSSHRWASTRRRITSSPGRRTARDCVR